MCQVNLIIITVIRKKPQTGNVSFNSGIYSICPFVCFLFWRYIHGLYCFSYSGTLFVISIHYYSFWYSIYRLFPFFCIVVRSLQSLPLVTIAGTLLAVYNPCFYADTMLIVCIPLYFTAQLI